MKSIFKRTNVQCKDHTSDLCGKCCFYFSCDYCHWGSGQQTWKRKEGSNRRKGWRKGGRIPDMLEKDQSSRAGGCRFRDETTFWEAVHGWSLVLSFSAFLRKFKYSCTPKPHRCVCTARLKSQKSVSVALWHYLPPLLQFLMSLISIRKLRWWQKRVSQIFKCQDCTYIQIVGAF